MNKVIIVADDFYRFEDNLYDFAETVESWLGSLSNDAISEMLYVYRMGYRFIVDESLEAGELNDDEQLRFDLIDDLGLSDNVFYELCAKGYIHRAVKPEDFDCVMGFNDICNVIDTSKYYLRFVLTCYPE